MEFDEERIAEWIGRWKTIRENADSEISVQNLRSRNLLAITKNPLLLYMTAKIFDSELTEPIDYTRGLIYKLFYDWTIKGKFKREKEAYHLPENYRQLLQNIAMCMRSIGADDGFIDYDTLKKHISIYQEEVPGEELFRVNELVLVAHFFKIKDRDRIRYIEFAHKSFREYLVAEKIFDLFREFIAAETMDFGKWLVIGRMLPKKEELYFLRDLLYTLPDEELIWLISLIEGQTTQMLVCSGRLKKATATMQKIDAINEIGTIYFRSINLSCLAYIACNMIYSKLNDRWQSLWENRPANVKQSSQRFYSTPYIFHVCCSTPGAAMIGGIYKQNWLTAKAFMNGIDLSETELEGIDLSHGNLKGTTLAKASLNRCSFVSANLESADCSGIACEGTDFSKSNCTKTDFSRATLQQVTFRDAKLIRADFENAKFVNVDFSGTRMEQCRFDGCTFQHVLFDADKITDCTGWPGEVEKNP